MTMTFAITVVVPIAILLAATQARTSAAFRVSPSRPAPPTRLLPSTRRPRPPASSSSPSLPTHRSVAIPPPSSSSSSSTALNLFGLFEDDEDEEPNEDEIPPELRDEIYAAEANTPAAQGRNARVVTYVLLTVAGVTTAFFNAFLSDLRFGEGSTSTDLATYGFGWVQENWVTGFAFTNKIGGGIGLLGAGLSGTLAEVEIRSRKENAEKIWAEMRRRKALKEQPAPRSSRRNKKSLARPSKKNMTGKQKKRLSALEELMDDDEEEATSPTTDAAEGAEPSKETKEEGSKEDSPEEKREGGILGSIKGFYEKADSMAASQALLLNKELEDRGIVEKITDETGLKVVGREEAAKGKGGKEE